MIWWDLKDENVFLNIVCEYIRFSEIILKTNHNEWNACSMREANTIHKKPTQPNNSICVVCALFFCFRSELKCIAAFGIGVFCCPAELALSSNTSCRPSHSTQLHIGHLYITRLNTAQQ